MTLNLGELQVLNPIARGSEGFVFRVKREDQTFALKVIDKKGKNFKADRKSISHPSILALQDSFEDEDNVYLLLEFCQESLASRVSRTPFSEHSKKAVIMDLIQGEQYIETSSPRTYFSNRTKLQLSQQKIADFGLAVSIDSRGACKTVCGTPSFMSPEQLQSQPYDFKADVWAIGLIIYYVLTGGKNLFEGYNFSKLLKKINQADLSSQLSQLSKQESSIVRKCLALDPKNRYTVVELKRDWQILCQANKENQPLNKYLPNSQNNSKVDKDKSRQSCNPLLAHFFEKPLPNVSLPLDGCILKLSGQTIDIQHDGTRVQIRKQSITLTKQQSVRNYRDQSVARFVKKNKKLLEWVFKAMQLLSSL